MGEDVRAHRIAFLERAVLAAGSKAKFARTHGVDPTYVSQLLSGHRGFGEKAARKMEAQCGWAPYVMDRPPGAAVSGDDTSDLGSQVLAAVLSPGAQLLGHLFDMHRDPAQRRDVWRRALDVLAPSESLRIAFAVLPRDASSAVDFGDARKRRTYRARRPAAKRQARPASDETEPPGKR